MSDLEKIKILTKKINDSRNKYNEIDAVFLAADKQFEDTLENALGTLDKQIRIALVSKKIDLLKLVLPDAEKDELQRQFTEVKIKEDSKNSFLNETKALNQERYEIFLSRKEIFADYPESPLSILSNFNTNIAFSPKDIAVALSNKNFTIPNFRLTLPLEQVTERIDPLVKEFQRNEKLKDLQRQMEELEAEKQ